MIINPPIIVVDTFLTGFWFETSFEKKRLATHFWYAIIMQSV